MTSFTQQQPICSYPESDKIQCTPNDTIFVKQVPLQVKAKNNVITILLKEGKSHTMLFQSLYFYSMGIIKCTDMLPGPPVLSKILIFCKYFRSSSFVLE
jgi:hypothetical protein